MVFQPLESPIKVGNPVSQGEVRAFVGQPQPGEATGEPNPQSQIGPVPGIWKGNSCQMSQLLALFVSRQLRNRKQKSFVEDENAQLSQRFFCWRRQQLGRRINFSR